MSCRTIKTKVIEVAVITYPSLLCNLIGSISDQRASVRQFSIDHSGQYSVL